MKPHPFTGRPVTLRPPSEQPRKAILVGESKDHQSWRLRFLNHKAYVQNFPKRHVTFDDEPQPPVDLMLPSHAQARLYATAFSV